MEGNIGEVRLWASNFAPRTWAFCEGQLMAISSNTALFSLIGTIYGGDGRTNFKLPDTRSRVVVSAGTGPGLSTYNIGQIGGIERVTLTQNQIPSHTHMLLQNLSAVFAPGALEDDGTTDDPTGASFANYAGGAKTYADTADSLMATSNGAITGTITAYDAGSSQSHTNVQPVEALHYIICLQGIFPSRN